MFQQTYMSITVLSYWTNLFSRTFDRIHFNMKTSRQLKCMLLKWPAFGYEWNTTLSGITGEILCASPICIFINNNFDGISGWSTTLLIHSPIISVAPNTFAHILSQIFHRLKIINNCVCRTVKTARNPPQAINTV